MRDTFRQYPTLDSRCLILQEPVRHFDVLPHTFMCIDGRSSGPAKEQWLDQWSVGD